MKEITRHIYMLSISKYDSLDPLKGDNWSNLHIQRLLYLTPIEQTVSAGFASTLLSSFSYDRERSQLIFELRKGLTFSNGSQIQPMDLQYSILRMLRARPNFPVIKDIIGADKWLAFSGGNLSEPPVGMKLSDYTLTIDLKKGDAIENPLHRFTSELFSIIPAKCIDPKTSEICCKDIPTSGYYELMGCEHGELKLRLRKAPEYHTQENYIPSEIAIHYSSVDILQKTAGQRFSNSVFLGLTHSLPEATSALFSDASINLKVQYFPASNFVVLLLNPNVAPFDNSKCRRQFANIFRSKVKNLYGVQADVQSSLFSEILPGYVKSFEDVEDNREAEVCEFKNRNMAGFYYGDNSWPLYNKAMDETVKQLGIKFAPFDSDEWSQIEEKFKVGEISFVAFRSGFWPLDPILDLQMLFTENLHPVLEFVAGDRTTKKLVTEIVGSHREGLAAKMEELNRYLHFDAKLNVFLYTRYYYCTQETDLLRKLPHSLAQPYLWQIFDR